MNRTIHKLEVDGVTIEYSTIGEGEPILLFHGGHSNCKEEFGFQSLIENGYSIITPSRAGYGETSKEIGDNLLKACTYYAKLLDHLEIEKAHIIAISAGGPTGIRFASLFPEKVLSLTLESAVCRKWLNRKDLEYKAAHIIFRPSTEWLTWKMLGMFSSLLPTFIFKVMAAQFSSLDKKGIKERMDQNDVKEFKRMNTRQRSGHGFLIDIKQTSDLTDQDLKKITCPTLILHSKNDGFIPLDHPQHAHETIPLSELHLLDSWGHLIWLGTAAKERDEKLLSFLRTNKRTIQVM